MGPIGKSHGKSIIIEVDAEGKILKSFHSKTGKVLRQSFITL